MNYSVVLEQVIKAAAITQIRLSFKWSIDFVREEQKIFKMRHKFM